MTKRSPTVRGFVVATLVAAAATAGTAAAGTTVLFEQPSVSGIANNVYVAQVDKGGLPTGTWDLVVLQRDPFTTSGHLVPTSWNATAQTGFTPASASTAELGFRNQSGTSTAIMEGDTVAAYLNSKDLPTTLSNQKMMITPQYRFPAGATPVPFASSTNVLNGELDLQIPVAVGRHTYVNADLLFVGPTGARVSYGVKLFQNGARTAVVGGGYDEVDNAYMINCPLDSGTQFLTKASTSGTSTGTPWTGWRHFQWSIDETQFVAALKRLAQEYPNVVQTTDPTQYVFAGFHLNAEFHYSPTPAELGWSMRGLKLWTSW
ncbi:MAG: hypothetical protein JSS29_12585 [Proteobacteria bacterium]|nr:hypothetical protein [Pseudomonadota bacterium]